MDASTLVTNGLLPGWLWRAARSRAWSDRWRISARSTSGSDDGLSTSSADATPCRSNSSVTVFLLEAGFGAAKERAHRGGAQLQGIGDGRVAETGMAQQQQGALLRFQPFQRLAHCLLLRSPLQPGSRVAGVLGHEVERPILVKGALLTLPTPTGTAQRIQGGMGRGAPEPAVGGVILPDRRVPPVELEEHVLRQVVCVIGAAGHSVEQGVHAGI